MGEKDWGKEIEGREKSGFPGFPLSLHLVGKGPGIGVGKVDSTKLKMSPHWKTVPPGHWPHARELRNELTDAERILWNAIRREQLGVKFRRQHAFGPFFLDFYASEIRLVIELDGGIHRQPDVNYHDVEREEYLRLRQRVMVHFTNQEVLVALDDVLAKLRGVIAELKTRPLSLTLSPQDVGEGGAESRNLKNKSRIPSCE